MLLSETRKARVEKIIEEKMASGNYPVADLTLFDSVKNLDIPGDKKLKLSIEYTYDEYIDYLKQIKELLTEHKQKEFQRTLRNMDIIDNQALEQEDSFLIALSIQVTGDRKFAITEMIKNYGNELDREKFLKFHDLILKGTTSYDKLGFRDRNTKFVGTWAPNEEEPTISYFPIDCRDVPKATDLFMNFYNIHINDLSKDYVEFVRPIVYHGLIAALQLFNDGNTRYGRLFQHVELWGMLSQYDDTKTELPILYATRQYIPHRNEYRKLIQDIVTKKDDEAWKEWISFNLKRLQDGMYKAEEDLKQITKRR